MEKRKCLTFLFCLMVCYSLFQHIAGAQSSSQAVIFSQGSITYSPSNVNLAVIPDDWHLIYSGDVPGIIHLDTSVERTAGKPSIRLEPHVDGVDINNDRECDGTWYNCKPGDHIVAKCWIKIDSNNLPNGTTDTNQWSGARPGIDLYGGSNLVWGIDEATYINPHNPAGTDERDQYVHWGTPGWTLRTIDFYVPSTTFNTTSRGVAITPTKVTSFVMWLQVWSGTINPSTGTIYGGSEPGRAWFADAELYINPT